ncbi:hypothetical protein GS528_16920 [Rhodococcus hoagii]|nr:hypothetical protein [Prescottella equi]
MSYSKFREKWFPRPDPRTPVTPEAIEHIEDGVKRAHDAIDALGDIGDNLANLVTKEEANATYAPAGAVARKRGPILDDQPARRLLFDALAEINSRPLIIPWLTASTGEGPSPTTTRPCTCCFRRCFRRPTTRPASLAGTR